MKTEQLQTFLAVASLGSFTDAARRVHVSQSTASLHIKELEEHVGVRLIDRATAGSRPTEAGRVMISYAHRLLGLQREALSEVRGQVGVPAGVLKVAVTAVGEAQVTRLLTSFAQRHPDVHVLVRLFMPEAALTAVRAGDCEVAFVADAPKDPDLIATWYTSDDIILVDLPAASAGRVRLLPWVACEFGNGQVLGRDLATPGVQPTLTVASPEAARRCVLDGAGCAFLPQSLVEEDLRLGRLARINWPGTPQRRSVHLVTQRGISLSAAAVEFRRAAVGEAT